jgi:hypothetical protein
MDINKIMDLFGLGDDKDEDLAVAMEKQILPEIQHKRRATDHKPAEGGTPQPTDELQIPAEELPEHTQFIKVGRCPSCGDQIMERAERPCAWCDTPCRPEHDGFHLVHIALGSFQERHCFCCDDCYEAFRRMYPARVHRNCYERPCADCNYCIKRYSDESEGLPGQEQPLHPQGTIKPEKA